MWLWVGGAGALVLAFCAGLLVHQRLLVPLRDVNQPYQTPPPEAQEQGPAGQVNQGSAAGAAGAGAVQPAPEALPGYARGAVPPGPGGAAAGAAKEPGGAAAEDAEMLPRYMAPARIGASPGLMAARLMYAPPPAYPMLAEMARIQGRVMVEAVVGKSGRVIRAQAISGHHLLRGAAVREVYRRRYRPYLLNGRPADVATIVTVEFELKR
jgi:protein TonB